MSKLPARKRFLTALVIGVAFGLFYAWFAPRENPGIFDWSSITFWAVVSNRILLGLVIAIVGTFTHHPVFGFRCPPFLRGLVIGALVSIPLGFSEMIFSPGMAVQVFWFAIGSGAFYGIVTDLIATKVGGEGKSLLA